MPNQRVWTSLKPQDYSKLKKQAEKLGVSDYALSKQLITEGLKKRTPLSLYSSKELLREIWRRIP